MPAEIIFRYNLNVHVQMSFLAFLTLLGFYTSADKIRNIVRLRKYYNNVTVNITVVKHTPRETYRNFILGKFKFCVILQFPRKNFESDANTAGLFVVIVYDEMFLKIYLTAKCFVFKTTITTMSTLSVFPVEKKRAKFVIWLANSGIAYSLGVKQRKY